MTYVEFFDKPASENICACLTDIPDRVIYIGDDRKQMERHIANYEKIFSGRGYNIEFSYKSVSKSNLDFAIRVISEIVEANDDCVFDITGGEEILLLALGIVCERYKDKNIQLHRINLRHGTVHDCDKDGNTIYKTPLALSVEENVRLFGGEVVYGDVGGEDTYKWELTPDFLKDVELIWSICRQDVRAWNAQLGVFMEIEKVGKVCEDGLTTVASRAAVLNRLNSEGRLKRIEDVLEPLLTTRLLTHYDDSDEDNVTITYKNKQVKRCLVKAGQALEMKIFTTIMELTNEDGSPVYTDALNGVVIDWDGDGERGLYDTENEIDVFLMHGVVPVFISCKNGYLSNEELYKLNTVAERFGGKYAKKVLVTNAIDEMKDAGKYLCQRAADMGIAVIKNIQDMDDKELAKKLKNVWQAPVIQA